MQVGRMRPIDAPWVALEGTLQPELYRILIALPALQDTRSVAWRKLEARRGVRIVHVDLARRQRRQGHGRRQPGELVSGNRNLLKGTS